jgi:hypothetical protein
MNQVKLIYFEGCPEAKNVRIFPKKIRIEASLRPQFKIGSHLFSSFLYWPVSLL